MRKRASLLVLLVGCTFAIADIPAPPPEHGTKYVEIHNSVVLDPSVTGLVFLVETGRGPGPPKKTYSPVSLSERPIEMPVGGKYTYVTLVAIPEAEAKKFKTDADLHSALEKGEVSGSSKMPFVSTGVASTKHPRDSINCTYTITNFDARKGLVWRTLREDQQTSPGEASSERPMIESVGQMPVEKEGYINRNTMIIAGVCLTIAVIGLGLWLLRRQRTA